MRGRTDAGQLDSKLQRRDLVPSQRKEGTRLTSKSSKKKVVVETKRKQWEVIEKEEPIATTRGSKSKKEKGSKALQTEGPGDSSRPTNQKGPVKSLTREEM
ncbi:hypothetical protein HAX54_047092 [Datura stramonium]|uniref:Uncharacterized protein n=1 Tax=Datura stramonium TaxID=4076 RepID=A0ABS8SRX5_DATST|nr:hypothetical protein [Datura stramonium]